MAPVITEWAGKGPGLVVWLGWGMAAHQVKPLLNGWHALVVGVHHPHEWSTVAPSIPTTWRQLGISWGVHGMTQPGWVIAGAYAAPHPGVLRLFDRDPDRFMTQFWEGHPPHPPVSTAILRDGLAWLQSADSTATMTHQQWWHGGMDTVIPVSVATQWAASSKTPLSIMPKATHLSWLYRTSDRATLQHHLGMWVSRHESERP